ncbi:cytochrome d ubiquinol oxidase subunit II [Acetobacter fabarum]|jgi:cytochrome d ubiquinol oxidase subunit II|uniref:Cytochrome d ubiquinol oxidase subunit II n=1 Tax=Acetobacter fabarum TaxID=483199 RepID=A0A269XY95_9PROT|nr:MULTISPECIES: cytochrome d ubiquinol oxidase subunit II [Acetobacter]MCH4025755.1 cytochrome d ubiquinol oxidase subunit II [Acetobacter fabarum]MCH4054592.1 cytochrome d ubiquinol oxidase subunit II [Acetobacter fabarum]MCH4086385.1 cytochrome d ubiquinol oxidase subunit II [Acetobacter fabarum]MCH4128835.1 cytochrome d ubiquinol oxidase subunit II [Acetobacter fabarum]MCH4138260.1 cytochrome d ubiquinol oxidase subunit II [Acetobacter fabarum]
MDIYVVLKLIWAGLLCVLLIGLGLMVGMDMGVGTLLRFVGRTDGERRTALNIIGPHWDGNQVWFILGGGAIFAAFPTLYATSFSVFYVVMILLLFSMILRPVAFEYRSKVDARLWRASWDWVFLVSGFLPMFVYGAAFGNILQGVGYHFNWTGQYFQDGSFLAYLLNPFAILCGLMAVCLSVMQGGVMLMIRSENPIHDRARRYASRAGLAAVALFLAGGVWIRGMPGFVLEQGNPAMPANPMQGQQVSVQVGAWLHNYAAHPVLWLLPVLGVVSMLAGVMLVLANRSHVAWWMGLGSWVGTIGTVAAAMFPFFMPSTTRPDQSLTIWNSSASQYGLTCMLAVALIFVPLILCYTSWCYYVMRGKVHTADIIKDTHSY